MLLVLSDDLTGALDTGVKFSSHGIPVTVYPDGEPDFEDHGSQGVLVLNLESRHLDREEAAGRVRAAVTASRSRGFTSWYKKTDSTLRGNIGSELSALLDACGTGPLMFIPAYPETGRTTKFGIQYVDGVQVSDTAYGSDPLDPLQSSYIPAVISEQSNVPVEVSDGLIFEEGDYPAGDRRIVVFDGETREDLIRIGNKLQEAGRLDLIAGCAGFASVVGEMLSPGPGVCADLHCPSRQFVICGSVNPVTIAQIEYSAGKGFDIHSLAGWDLITEQSVERTKELQLSEAVKRSLESGRDILLCTAETEVQAQAVRDFLKTPGVNRFAYIHSVTAKLGSILASIMASHTRVTLSVSGGDTALGLIRSLGTRRLIPVKEIFPGVVLSKARLEDGCPAGSYIPMISKAGGFGDEGLFVDIRHYCENPGRFNR